MGSLGFTTESGTPEYWFVLPSRCPDVFLGVSFVLGGSRKYQREKVGLP